MITIIKINDGYAEKEIFEEKKIPKEIEKIINSKQPYVLMTPDRSTYIINNEYKKIQPFIKRYLARIGKDPMVFYVFLILGLGFFQLILTVTNVFSGPNFEEIYKNLSQNIIMMDKNFQEKQIKIQTNFDSLSGTLSSIQNILSSKTIQNVK